jgi:alkanesulfonate monooxygenase SsuD/methylene tetrahydromethanopterin reductase-like flavin-dependent oxidoreductase (luciferase family)
LHSAKYLREVVRPAIDAGAAKSGRTVNDIKLCAPVFTVTEDAQREKVREQISFYGSTPNYRPVLDCHGWHEIGEKLTVLSRRGQWADMPREITDEMVETFAVVAKPSELAERLLARYDGLLDSMHPYQPNAFEPMKDEALSRMLIDAFHAKRSS